MTCKNYPGEYTCECKPGFAMAEGHCKGKTRKGGFPLSATSMTTKCR